MAGFLIAIISGTLMSLQGAFNTNVTKASSVWVTAMFVQLTALATCAIMWVIDGRPDIMKLFKVDNKITLLGGVIGAFITFTVIKSISGLGSGGYDCSCADNCFVSAGTFRAVWK